MARGGLGDLLLTKGKTIQRRMGKELLCMRCKGSNVTRSIDNGSTSRQSNCLISTAETTRQSHGQNFPSTEITVLSSEQAKVRVQTGNLSTLGHSLMSVMSCHVMSCHVMSCHVMSCHVMSCHVDKLEQNWTQLCNNLMYSQLFVYCLM